MLNRVIESSEMMRLPEPKRTSAPDGRRGQPSPLGFVRPGACAFLLAASLACAQEPVPAPGGDPVREYLDAIAGAEAIGGAYAIELIDLYYGMGQSLLQSGEYDQARDALHRAAMVARVNFGPYSLEQARYLYSIADVEFRVGDPQAAADALDHIYRIHAREYGEDDPAMLPVVEEIHAWYVDRLTAGTAPVLASDYQNLSFLMGRIAQLTETRDGLGTPRTALRYRALGQSHYRAIRHIIEAGQPPEPELVMNAGEASKQVAPDRLLVSHLLEGEEALKRAVQSWEVNPEGSELEVAEALAQLGDWNLALGFERAAAHQYEQAYQVLANSEEFGFLAADYLGTPAPLRLMNTSGSFLRDLHPAGEDGGLVISMTVTPDGRLRNVELTGVPASVPEDRLPVLKAQLETTLFRPAVVEGEVRTVEGFTWKAPAGLEDELLPD